MQFYRFLSFLILFSFSVEGCKRTAADLLPEFFLLDSLQNGNYSVGGTITGLLGSNLLLNNSSSRGLQTIGINSPATNYSFPATLHSFDSYSISIGGYPTLPTQYCTIANSNGIISGMSIGNVNVDCINAYLITGDITGLTGGGLTLQNNGTDDLILNAGATKFQFFTPVSPGGAYSVQVMKQPTNPAQNCQFSGSTSGTVNTSNVVLSVLNCGTNNYSITLSITNLLNSGLTVSLNSGPQQSIPAGSASFSLGTFPSGTDYDIQIGTYPAGQNCTVFGGMGTITNSNVTVTIQCTSTGYPVGGSLSNLNGAGLTLNMTGSVVQSVTRPAGSTSYSFSQPLILNNTYIVSISVQPSGQSCTFPGGTTSISGIVTGPVTLPAIGCLDKRTISVTIAGLGVSAGDTITLALSSSHYSTESIAHPSNSIMTFTTQIEDTYDYTITISGYNSTGQICSFGPTPVRAANQQLALNGTVNGNVNVTANCRNKYVKIDGSQYHSAAIRADGTLWMWGYNGYGQLSTGDFTDRLTPTQVLPGSQWIDIAGGGETQHAIRSDGTLWAVGWGNYGKLGLGDALDRTAFSQVGTSNLWQKIFWGYYSAFGIQTDGTSWEWGNNSSAELGRGYRGQTPVGCWNPPTACSEFSPLSSPVGAWNTLSIYLFNSIGIKTDGTLWSWGSNSSGELGLGYAGNLPAGCSSASPCNEWSPQQVAIGTTWLTGSAGYLFAVAIRADGTLWTWGSNGSGELGRGYNGLTPVGCGAGPCNEWSPQQVGTFADWIKVSSKEYFTIALRANGSLWSWGLNSSGELGLGYIGNTPVGSTTCNEWSPQRIGFDLDWMEISTGSFHVLALKTDGTLWAWGANWNGELGTGDNVDRTSPTPIW